MLSFLRGMARGGNPEQNPTLRGRRLAVELQRHREATGMSREEVARRPVSIRYTAADSRRRMRTLHPYGLVTHSGRWYVTGADRRIGEDRTFRLDRIADARTLPGSFEPPAGLDPARRVLSALATAPYRHQVTLRIQATAEQIRARLPASVASIESDGADPPAEGWLRVDLRAERLDWVPAVLASLDRPFVIERPDELRSLVTALADRLAASARAG